MIDLKLVQKPQRYVGNEWNVIKKTKTSRIKICISYPDLYELGMSNLGLRIIYGLLNQYSQIVCERVFMPGDDLIKLLKEKNKKLFSLENKIPLDKFDVLGFHLGYELNFTNFLTIVELGGIPLKAEERKDIIIIGGGIANPEPIAEFVDLFFLGEFEEVADKFVAILEKCEDKQSRLQAFSQTQGFYVPAFYSVNFKNQRFNFEKKYSYAQFPLQRVFAKDLDKSFYPRRWIVPHTAITHDRAQIEIARGCPNRCVFCQARASYYPYREKKISTIVEAAKKIYESSGYENFSFLALSASDYSKIEELIESSLDYFGKRKIGLSLPSLKISDLVGKLYEKLALLKKTSLTIAIEAARSDLRNRLNKNIDIKELFEAAKVMRSLKMKHIKTYFMYGFPNENEDDLIAIAEFLKRLSRESKLLINASINIFVPKPFSLWEGALMEKEGILLQKTKFIQDSIARTNNIKVSLSMPKKSILEAVISRADRRFSSVIYRAYKKGARFDGYRERFSWNIWEEAMKEERINYRFYLEAKTDNYPWSFIVNGES